ncbi:DUF2977 domain-containing protein [Mammaliicoccus sp. F-M27]|uniref:DUF2977 domain-containing protein n=1 Tax=Mammaliicoccus sp. F-M27 TaxID=2898687 RepID=UPI001EFBB180|nr:DUF2977 domain-containing protein [Mammaliicoccus sp. F-M27]
MKIKVDNELILSYAIIGNIDNSIEINDDIVPSNFIDDFKPNKYRYSNEQIVLNENYTEYEEQPILPPITEKPSNDEELRKMFAEMQVQLVQANMMVMQVSQQNADLFQQILEVKQEIENIKGENLDGNVIPEV